MAIDDVADQYFTYESRLASFQTQSKRRVSNASAKASKSTKWPHKFLTPEELSRSGFFYNPKPTSNDNVACFLCRVSIDGWETEDDPLVEHLRHSPDCGWAIVATIERQDGVLSLESPASKRMIEARKATFADKWPHENKKGWKCKTKQLVDAGWKYTPTPESDDMATCTYCQLALDGWENSDKPLEEHYNRSSDCAFFTLINQAKSPAAKRTKAKRVSKASRLSTQSQLTIASDIHDVTDLAAEEGDSILTTATTATGRKMGKAKKAPAAKGRKTRAKKVEPVEVEVEVEVEPEAEAAPEPEDADFEVKVEVAPKPTRGKKRKSEQEPDSSIMDIVPPPKRRATKTRGSMAVEDSVMVDPPDTQEQHVVPKKGGKSRTARTRGSMAMDESVLSVAESSSQGPAPKSKRGRPSRKASMVSVASPKAAIPSNEEIDAALEADLEQMSDVGTPAAPPKKPTRASKISKTNHAMFDPEPMVVDEASIDAELEAMEVESKPLPKAKGAKGKQPRKVSAKQQAAARKAAEAEAEAAAEAERLAEEEEASQQIASELEHSISIQPSSPIIQPKRQRGASRQPARKAPGRTTRGSTMSAAGPDSSMMNDSHNTSAGPADESGNETDASMASQSTVVRGGAARRGSTMKKGGKKGRSRNIEEIVHKPVEQPVIEPALDEPAPEEPELEEPEIEEPEPEEEVSSGNLLEVPHAADVSMEDFYTPAPEAPPAVEEPAEQEQKKAPKPRGRPKKSQTSTRDSVSIVGDAPEPVPTQTKSKVVIQAPRSPTPPPRETTPSDSPQSSDAENHPPSSKPSTAAKKLATPHSTKRIPLAEASTPSMSPSKRNIIAGLQTLHPWSAVDLDTVFTRSPGGENVIMNSKSLFGEELKTGVLTSPEKKMSVEEWIHFNAEQAEEKLRIECERMVGGFEEQGTRAMRALEGIECLE